MNSTTTNNMTMTNCDDCAAYPTMTSPTTWGNSLRTLPGWMKSVRRTFTSTVSLTNGLLRLKTFTVWSPTRRLSILREHQPHGCTYWHRHSHAGVRRGYPADNGAAEENAWTKLLKNGHPSLTKIRSRLMSARPRRSLHLRRNAKAKLAEREAKKAQKEAESYGQGC